MYARRLAGIVALMACIIAVPPAVGAPRITRFRRGLSGFPISITVGPKRSLWFTEGRGGKATMGRISTRGRIREFRKGLTGQMFADPSAIVAGPDGNVWFSEQTRSGGGIIGRITPRGKVTEFRKGLGGIIGGLAAGPDGNLWFTEALGQRGAVGRITPAGSIKVFSARTHGPPLGITKGIDGNLWFIDSGQAAIGEGLVRVTPAGDVTEFSVGFNGTPIEITTGPDGALWFTEFGHVGTATPSAGGVSHVRSFSIGSPNGFVHAIAVGPDRALWFAPQNETGFTKVGRVTTSGKVSRFGKQLGSPRGSFLDGITTGPDHNIWFTEAGRSSRPAIDRLKP